LTANSTILSTGAGTAKLLARGASDRPELQSGDRITAAAVVTGIVRLSLEQRARFEKSPIFVHAIDGVLGDYHK
jgi:sarcosine oxidase/L-pipecolate oxidase